MMIRQLLHPSGKCHSPWLKTGTFPTIAVERKRNQFSFSRLSAESIADLWSETPSGKFSLANGFPNQ